MIKLLACDVDGTLLNEQHTIDKEVVLAIQHLQESGVHFLPTSGRDYYALQKAVEELDIQSECICLNGAEFYGCEGELVASIPFSQKKAREIHAYVSSHVAVEDIEYIYNKKRYLNISKRALQKVLVDKAQNIKALDEQRKRMFLSVLKKIMACEEDIEKILEHPILKIEMHFSNDVLRNQIIAGLETIDGIAITSSSSKNIELNDILATKGNMVLHVAKQYGYCEHEIAVVGDGMNDISMLSKFEHSYAMGQASACVKKAAKRTTVDNAHGGVAAVIYEILQINKKETL
ncbi:MAG: Cof-type HAD-IIB family hydrolase [Breznakia sp.]